MRNWSEKFPELVVQAFQPVRLNEAGETPALRSFHNLYRVAVKKVILSCHSERSGVKNLVFAAVS